MYCRVAHLRESLSKEKEVFPAAAKLAIAAEWGMSGADTNDSF